MLGSSMLRIYAPLFYIEICQRSFFHCEEAPARWDSISHAFQTARDHPAARPSFSMIGECQSGDAATYRRGYPTFSKVTGTSVKAGGFPRCLQYSTEYHQGLEPRPVSTTSAGAAHYR